LLGRKALFTQRLGLPVDEMLAAPRVTMANSWCLFIMFNINGSVKNNSNNN